MLKKLINTIMAGIYVSIGAIAFLVIPNPIVASCFFAVGLLLVVNFHEMLLTRVIPLYFFNKEYNFVDIIIAIFGNSIGCVLTATLIYYTRVFDIIKAKSELIVNTRLNDNLLSIFILAIFCAVLVAFASFAYKKYEKESFARIFYLWLFITVFVICGFEHFVADVFYFAIGALQFGFNANMLLILLVVLAGNFVGGMFVGILQKMKK